jgi:hypothetical protein
MNASRLAGFVVAGAAATWFMDRIDKVVYLLQSEDVHRREAALEELTGPGELARRVMCALGRRPSHDEAVAAGRLVHVAFGISSAVGYGIVADGLPALRAGNGLLFGLLLAPANIVVVPAIGLTPPTWKFPRETTIRSVIYHLAYGVALESTARALRLHRDRPRLP